MNNSKRECNIFQTVLTIGPDYQNSKGGIASVLKVYSTFFGEFNFVATQKEGNFIVKFYIFIKAIFKVFRILLKNKDIDIVHIHGSSYGSFYRKYFIFVISKFLFKKKVIYHIHSGRFDSFYSKGSYLAKKLIENLTNKSDCIICLSEEWGDVICNLLSPKRIEILPNVISVSNIGNRMYFKDNKLNLLFLGLICHDKGIFDLLKVIELNRRKYMGIIKLTIGGNGEVDRLKSLIVKHKLDDMVEFVGWVTADVKEDCLLKSDVYVLPSYHEGLPISILEAMSYKQCIIASRVGGIPTIVDSYSNGILVDAGNLSEIKDALDFFINNPDKVEVFGQNSFDKVLPYSPDIVSNKLITLYETL